MLLAIIDGLATAALLGGIVCAFVAIFLGSAFFLLTGRAPW